MPRKAGWRKRSWELEFPFVTVWGAYDAKKHKYSVRWMPPSPSRHVELTETAGKALIEMLAFVAEPIRK